MNTRNYQEQKFTEKILNEHLKTKPKWLATCGKVNRYTRAGKHGKFIICPICEQGGWYITLVGQHYNVSIVVV